MCPNCGSEDSRPMRIDEAPYRLAARSARALRDCGEVDAAADVLSALASVKIVNFLRRYARRCRTCGVQYD